MVKSRMPQCHGQSQCSPQEEGTCLYDPLSLSTMAARSRPAPLTKMLNGLLDGISDGKDEVRDIACLGESYQAHFDLFGVIS